jgi:uncharacterized protein (TIGR00299 family) protein
MSKVLYFDAFNGVSGDMILGALVDMGLPLDHLKAELMKLRLEGYTLRTSAIERGGLRGTNLQVRLHPEEGLQAQEVDPSEANHRHDNRSGETHRHAEPSRDFGEIRSLIEKSGVSDWVKGKSIAIFSQLARAEAKVHLSSMEEVHFHEVGAVDAIVDIVGSCVGFQHFGVEKFYVSPITLGSGTVTFSHGTWPVPAPATAQLLCGFPTRLGGAETELTTPTGAAIVATLTRPSEAVPVVAFEKWGFGAGDRELPGIPNMLRLMLGQTVEQREVPETAGQVGGLPREDVILLEAGIDDMDAEMCGHFLERALQEGALDVYFTPILMKKSRPAQLLSLLCLVKDQERMVELVFRETTTLGLRVKPQQRWVLERELRKVETDWGPVRVKVGLFKGEVVNVAAEYEDLKSIAGLTGLSLKQVRQKVMEKVTELQL